MNNAGAIRILKVGLGSASSTATLATMLLALGSSTTAQAQQEQSSQQNQPEVVSVTGTLIREPNLASDSPINTVTEQTIGLSNVQNIEDLTNSQPSITTSFNSGSNPTSIGSSTVANVDLRGLGPTRNLVLIDGTRVGPGDPVSLLGAAADLHFIPAPLVKGVDVLTGGAAAIYGSDAIAGVVNFHLIRDFDGLQLSFSLSGAQHDNNNSQAEQMFANTALLPAHVAVPTYPSSVFDGFVGEVSGILGFNSKDDKGNVTFFADYKSDDPVVGSTRDFDSCPTSVADINGTGSLVCTGSSSTPYGNISLSAANNNGYSGAVAFNPNGSATFVPYTASYSYNYNNLQDIQDRENRTSFGALGHYKFSKNIEVYTDLMYMRDEANEQGAGSPWAGGVPGLFTTLNIPCSNPYIGQTVGPIGMSEYQALGCAKPGVTTAKVTFPGFRPSDPRLIDIVHNDYRILSGIRGEIDENWSYDLSMRHWEADYNRVGNGYTSIIALNNAISAGTADIFQYGGFTPAQQAAVSPPATQSGYTREDDVIGQVNGDLGAYGGKSPYASDPIATAFGLEWRHTILSLTPDANYQAGYVLGGGGAIAAVHGGESVGEAFTQFHIPLVQDAFLAKSWTLDLVGRHSEYSVDQTTLGFSTNTYEVSTNYQPIEDVRFRASYNRAVRAPNPAELFLPNTILVDSTVSDVCGSSSSSAQLRAACVNPALGTAALTPSQIGNYPVCAPPALYCNAEQGGNLNLKPERGDTYTVGVSFTPSFLPGFSGSLDYWDVKLTNKITTAGGGVLLSGCYNGVTAYCSDIVRDPSNGSLADNGYITETYLNLASNHNAGVDVDLQYSRPIAELGLGIPDKYGSLSTELTGTDTMRASIQTLPSSQPYDCAGKFGETACVMPYPRWRHQMRTTWETPWDLDFSVNWRFISGTALDVLDPTLPGYGKVASACGGLANCSGVNNTIGDYNYIDLAANYRFSENYSLKLGVKNLFDKDPPLLNNSYAVAAAGNVAQGNIASNSNTFTMYDLLGRVVYLGFVADF